MDLFEGQFHQLYLGVVGVGGETVKHLHKLDGNLHKQEGLFSLRFLT
jgi:hypothetical protein